MKLKDQPLPS